MLISMLTPFLTVLVLILALPPVARAAGPDDPWTKVSPGALEQLDEHSSAVVMVKVAPIGPERTASGVLPAPAAVDRGQQALLAGMAGRKGWSLRGRLSTIPWLVLEVDRESLMLLAYDPSVLQIIPDRQNVTPATAQSVEVIGAGQIRRGLGLTGAGINIGIIDTGIDLTHPDIANSLVAGRHFLNQGNDIGPNVQDNIGHGSHIAGILTGDGLVAPEGVAPDAGLVVAKIFDAVTTSGFYSDLARALDWMIEQNGLLANPIRWVNLSVVLGEGLPAQCPCDSNPIVQQDFAIVIDAIDRAIDAGIVCVAPSGNDGDLGAIRAPACFQNVIAVGATTDRDFPRIPPSTPQNPNPTFPAADGFAPCSHPADALVDTMLCFSNRHPFCPGFIAAPGYNITSVALTNGGDPGTINSYGTSQATAHVTGSLALLQQAAPGLSNLQAFTLLLQTAQPIPLNPAQPNGSKVGRVDILAAINAATNNAARRWTVYE